MHTSFADQLARLDLAGFSIGPAPVSTSDFPVREAVVQTLEAVWSDLFAMVSGTALEADAEDIGWAFVNIFHRSAERKSTALDRATDEVRALIATADGSEVHTHDLETQVERAQCAESAMLALEEMREVAAALYQRVRFLLEAGLQLALQSQRHDDFCARRRSRFPARPCRSQAPCGRARRNPGRVRWRAHPSCY